MIPQSLVEAISVDDLFVVTNKCTNKVHSTVESRLRS